MTKPLIIFSHANSFVASTYQLMLEQLRQDGFEVHALERFGHNPKYPVTGNWPHLVQELCDFSTAIIERLGQPAFFVGHSLGGLLSLLCAARHPSLARGVVMLDSPILSGWKSYLVGAGKRNGSIRIFSPGKVSKSRRDNWTDFAEAMAHFKSKEIFARWHPQVLADYVAHGTHDAEGRRVLTFERAIETEIYNTIPHNVPRMLKKTPLQCPLAFIGGTRSKENQIVGMKLTRTLARNGVQLIEGGHLFPMEQPAATASALSAALKKMISN